MRILNGYKTRPSWVDPWGVHLREGGAFDCELSAYLFAVFAGFPEVFGLEVEVMDNPDDPVDDHDDIEHIQSRTQIYKICVIDCIAEAIDEEQGNFNKNEQNVLEDLQNHSQCAAIPDLQLG